MANNQEDPYKEISNIVSQIYTGLNEAQQILAKEALKGQDNHPIYLKGKSLVSLICHDYCLSKYPFKKYTFDYEQYVNTYLESDRYEWIMADILNKIEQNWEIDNSINKGAMKLLQILSGAFTTETNNKNRQKKITDLKYILYYIFELNFICTSFTRPNFSPQECSYKQIVNSVSQKLQNKFKFNFDIDCDDMKNPIQNIDGFKIKPKQSNFRSYLNFLDEVNIQSIGELSKNASTSLLCKEILSLMVCFKECSDGLEYIEEQLIGEQQQNLPQSKDVLIFVISYMHFYAQGNIQLIDQSLDDMVEKSQEIKNADFSQFSNMDQFSAFKNSQSASRREESSAYSIKSTF